MDGKFSIHSMIIGKNSRPDCPEYPSISFSREKRDICLSNSYYFVWEANVTEAFVLRKHLTVALSAEICNDYVQRKNALFIPLIYLGFLRFKQKRLHHSFARFDKGDPDSWWYIIWMGLNWKGRKRSVILRKNGILRNEE